MTTRDAYISTLSLISKRGENGRVNGKTEKHTATDPFALSSTLFFVYSGVIFPHLTPSLCRKWNPHPKRLTPCATISTTGAPGDMTAGNVYKPSESEQKCPETLVNKQKTTSLVADRAFGTKMAARRYIVGSNPVTPMRKPLKSLGFKGFLFLLLWRLAGV